MKKYRDLLGLVHYLNQSIEQGKTIGQKKLIKIGDLLKPYIDSYNDKREWILLSNASVDENKNLIVDENNAYKYTAEAAHKRDKELMDLFLSDFDYTPIQINSPSELDQYTFLYGWVNGVEFTIEPEEEVEI
jgi:hypothetical protein